MGVPWPRADYAIAFQDPQRLADGSSARTELLDEFALTRQPAADLQLATCYGVLNLLNDSLVEPNRLHVLELRLIHGDFAIRRRMPMNLGPVPR